MWIFLLWWCIDDYIAYITNTPELGMVPWWVGVIVALMLGAFIPVRK